QEGEEDRGDPEDVLVPLEHAVVAVQPEERRAERGDADHDPKPLPEGVVGAEPVDLRHADRGQERRHRQQVRVGERHRQARDDVGDEVEAEEEDGVPERAARDLRLERDVDGGEADRRQRADREECGQFAVAQGHRDSNQTTSAATSARTTIPIRTTRTRFGFPTGPVAPCNSVLLASVSTSSGGTTIVSPPGSGSAYSRVCSSGSSSSPVSAGIATVSSRLHGASEEIRNATAVMLSSPPPRFAAATSALTALSRSSRFWWRTSRISSSSTMSLSPSEQMRKTSPSSASIVNPSTSTSGSVPTARVITLRCGWAWASSSESLTLVTSSLITDGSSVSCSMCSPRTR